MKFLHAGETSAFAAGPLCPPVVVEDAVSRRAEDGAGTGSRGQGR